MKPIACCIDLIDLRANLVHLSGGPAFPASASPFKLNASFVWEEEFSLDLRAACRCEIAFLAEPLIMLKQ